MLTNGSKKKSSNKLKGLYISSMFGLSQKCKAILTLENEAMWFYILTE